MPAGILVTVMKFPFVCTSGGLRDGWVANLVFTLKLNRFKLAGALCCLASVTQAQINSWIKPGSGNWEEPAWSLGALPGPSQSIQITNAGWKSVAIGAGTTQNYPQTLSVNSVSVLSPENTVNSLLLNYAGLQVPLTVNAMTIGSNSTLNVLNSALRLNGPGGLSIGGQVTQDAGAQVTGNQIDLGYVGPGIYNLADGTLSVNHVWLGPPYDGVFNQTGGNNSSGIVHLESGGQYHFYGGAFSSQVYFSGGGPFYQHGGNLDVDLALWQGSYVLENGAHYGALTIPITDGYAIANGNSSALQTGGTNVGSISLGNFGSGTYTLSNGIALAPTISVGYYGNLVQSGGWLGATGQISITGQQVNRDNFAGGHVILNSGTMESSGIYISTGRLDQNGGTNLIHGALTYNSSAFNYCVINGGLLAATSATLSPAWEGGLYLNGGQLLITNDLTVLGYGDLFWEGFKMSGGVLSVSNIIVNNQAIFTRIGGTINQSGRFTLSGGTITAGAGLQQFGPLLIGSSGGVTNSVIRFPPNAAEVRFQDSSDEPWSSGATVTIENWQGAPFSSTGHRLIFGTNAGALTTQQLNRILFHNPPGISPGYYPATILSTGEVIPNTLPPTGRIQPTMALTREPDLTMRLTVRGSVGDSYSIEVSSNLTTWVAWTNQVASNGTITVVDTDATNHFVRFYRALLLP